jgi:hypothetical protein
MGSVLRVLSEKTARANGERDERLENSDCPAFRWLWIAVRDRRGDGYMGRVGIRATRSR